MYRILIPDGESCFCCAVTRGIAAERSFQPVIVSRQWSSPARFSRYCGHFAVDRGGVDRGNCVAGDHCPGDRGGADYALRVEKWAKRWNADVVLPIDVPGIEQAIQARGHLEGRVRLAPLPRAEMFQTANDKGDFAKLLLQHELPHPATTLLAGDASDRERAALIEFPALVKPRRSSNGIGICYFERREDLLDLLAKRPEYGAGCVLQTHVPGMDIDCSVICQGGRIVASTIQRAKGYESAAFRPAGVIEFIEHERVLNLVSRLVEIMDWNGVAHLDLRIDRRNDEILLIEMNPRFWGSLLGSLYAGVNFAAIACRLALGLPVEVPPYRPCEYRSGSAAFATWRETALRWNSQKSAAFTAVSHIFRDPLPELVEVMSRLRLAQLGRKLLFNP